MAEMAEVCWHEHDWRWDAGLIDPESSGDEEWAMRATRFELGEPTDEDWQAVADLDD